MAIGVEDLTLVLTSIIVLIALVSLLVQLKRPHITFSLIHSRLPVHLNGKLLKELDILAASVVNQKGRLGDSARGIRCALMRNAIDLDRNALGTFYHELPWTRDHTDEIRVTKIPQTETDFAKLLEAGLFTRDPLTLPQGHGAVVAIAYRIKDGSRILYASRRPVESDIPPEEKKGLWVPFRIEVAGENLPSTVSNPSFLTVFRGQPWTVPESSRLQFSPSKLRNSLLRLGIQTERVRFLPSSERGVVELVPLELVATTGIESSHPANESSRE